jgi:hypothetical protein
VKSYPKNLAAGVLALLPAVPVAVAVFYINETWAAEAEKAVKTVGAMFAFLAALPMLIYLLKAGASAGLDRLGLVAIGTVGVLLTACYFFQASFYILFPADIFIWSESDFVNDILKFRQGYPIFTAEVNNESFTYVPGAQLVTYFLAWLAGHPVSVSAYRAIQLFYTALAAVAAFFCCRRLLETARPDGQKASDSPLWGAVWLTGLFLIATNGLTNPFNHLLHNDALAQLFTVTAYWLLLEYETKRNKKLLWLMAIVPAAGFWIKQSLIIWAFFYLAYLAVFVRPRSIQRVFWFGLAAGGFLLASVAAGYWLWQDNFIYWVFTVLGAHGVSPLRSFRHLLTIWPYFAAGLLGGAVLLQASGFKKLFGLWFIWLALISVETYTSGVAWMINHIGPGCLIAGVWFWAGTAAVWNRFQGSTIKNATAAEWFRAGAAAVLVLLLFSGFGVVRVPVRPFDFQDAERYIGEIENEFTGEMPEKVLLDLGSWVYLPNGVIMKDRAPAIGERGYSQTGDFSGILRRIEEKNYSKILVRNLHSPDFWYDHEMWNRPSGIRQALLENYREAGRIDAVKGFEPNMLPYGLSQISILVPRSDEEIPPNGD